MITGIIGAGTMGTGIALTFATYKHQVLWCGTSEEAVKKAKSTIEKRLANRAAKGKIRPQEAGEILDRIKIASQADCAVCDLIAECIPEDMERKRELFLQLDEVCKDDCIFCTVTSSLSVTEMGAGIRHPVIGMHFFNPAPVMKLVEVIPGLNTPAEVTHNIIALAKSIDKVPVEVKENAGFVVNRILIPMINEAICLYAEGIASAEDIDTAMKLGANHPMGPLELCDFIGLDVCLAIMETLQAETGDIKYRPHPLLRKMVRGGWLGVKSGKGFYQYDTE